MGRKQRKKRSGGTAGADRGQSPAAESPSVSPAARVVFGAAIVVVLALFVGYFMRSTTDEPQRAEGPRSDKPARLAPSTAEPAQLPEPDSVMTPVSREALELAAQGESLLNAGRVDEAIAALKQAIAADASLSAPLVNLGNAYVRKRAFTAAVDAYERALALQPDSVPAHTSLGVALTALGRLPDAIGHFAKAVELDPNSAAAQFNLGNANADLGRLADAERALRAALTLNPEHRDARFKLGIVLQQSGKQAEAISVFGDLLRRAPDDVGAHYRLALSLIATKQYDEAVRQYEEVIALRPMDAALAYDIGQAFYDKTQYRPAGVAFKYATMVNPGLVMAYLKAGNGYQRINQLTEAEDQFRAGLANVGPDTETRVQTALHFNLANVLMVQERGAEAIAEYQQALDLDPMHVGAQYGIGLAFEHEMENESAIDAYEATLRLDPNHEGAKTHLSLLREGRLPQANE